MQFVRDSGVSWFFQLSLFVEANLNFLYAVLQVVSGLNYMIFKTVI